MTTADPLTTVTLTPPPLERAESEAPVAPPRTIDRRGGANAQHRVQLVRPKLAQRLELGLCCITLW